MHNCHSSNFKISCVALSPSLNKRITFQYIPNFFYINILPKEAIEYEFPHFYNWGIICPKYWLLVLLFLL